MKVTTFSIEDACIKPSIEIGAFEALWANGISSYKQLHEKLLSKKASLLSQLIEFRIAEQFYVKTVDLMRSAGIDRFGVRIEGTIDYPIKLYDADYPLRLFYYRGNWDLVYLPGISVVGTRNPTPEGIRRTKRLVKELVQAKFAIYSGLAKGIDTAAHQAAIEFGGYTVAVTGTPLCQPYPKENTNLQNEIAQKHLLISQVPIVSYKEKGNQFTRLFFPERNKTMSALSNATVIVEAGETSGTLVQAKAALKQGRKVFILNSNFENSKLTWPHKLERKGAIRVNDFDEILKGLTNAYNQSSENR